jgi:hypothetical protein
MTPELPAAVLVALFAPDLGADQAWRDEAAWRAAPSVELQGVNGAAAEPAAVRALWNAEVLCFEFRCRDRVLVSPADRDGVDHFTLGDTVEVFVAPMGRKSYLEVHATPAGKQTIYAFRDYRRAAPPVAGEGIAVRAGQTRDGWRAVMVIPWSALGGGPDKDSWEMLAGRYDYDKSGGPAVLSSWPAQTGRPDFHDRARFARLELQR